MGAPTHLHRPSKGLFFCRTIVHTVCSSTRTRTPMYALSCLNARIDPRTSDPIGPTVGMSAFLLPKTGDATRIIPTQVHEVWRTRLPVYQTPLRLEAWTDALKWHPDIEFVHDVIDGIEFGRAMGFRGDRFLQRDCTNPPAHQVHQPVLREIRETELRNGWRVGPFPCRDTPPLFNLMATPQKQY